MKLPIISLFLSALAVFSASAAWPFSSKKENAEPATAVKASPRIAAEPGVIEEGSGVVTNRKGEFILRPHLKLDEKSELEFRALISSRYQIQEDLLVLRRIQDEKRQEVARFSEKLKEDFAIDGTANYEYDADNGRILSLTLKDGATTNAAPQFDKKEHRKLESKEDRDRFVRLVAAKQLSMEQIESIGLLTQEKMIELQAVQGSINKKFATTGERNYRYDRESKMLYEMVPVPQPNATTPVPMNNQEAKQKK